MSVASSVRPVRWGLQHGLPRVVLRRQAHRQDPLARLITNPELRADPWAVYDTLRDQGELVQTRFAMVTASHAKAREILRSDQYGVGNEYAAFPGITKRLIARSRSTAALKPNERPTMVVMDPPEHTRYRRLVAKVFSPRAVEAMRSRIEQHADGLLDRIAGKSSVNLVDTYTSMLPMIIIADILGIPDDDLPLLASFGNAVSLSLENGLSWSDYSSSDQGLRHLNSWMQAHIERTRQQPNESLLSQLIVARDEGGQLNALELRATANLLLNAGFMTSTSMLSQGAVLLMEHPDQLAILQTGTGNWANAIDEILRLEAPLQLTTRTRNRESPTASEECSVGTRVVILTAAANRDPAVFPDPHRFDVERSNAREHLSFAAGRHFCIGSGLARLTGEIGLHHLFTKYPHLTLTGTIARQPLLITRSWLELPVTGLTETGISSARTNSVSNGISPGTGCPRSVGGQAL